MTTNNEIITAWVTKYALSAGIERIEGQLAPSGTSIYCGTFGYANKGEWHRTPKAALARAEDMRVAKIASLKKSIVEMERLKFTAS